jgi:hypothetical protein
MIMATATSPARLLLLKNPSFLPSFLLSLDSGKEHGAVSSSSSLSNGLRLLLLRPRQVSRNQWQQP